MVQKGGVGVDGSELGVNGHTDMLKDRDSHILISSEVSFLFSRLSVSSHCWQLLVRLAWLFRGTERKQQWPLICQQPALAVQTEAVGTGL